jgi:hypothetical protein
MTELKKDWTHVGVKITDIRKLSKLYVLYTDISVEQIDNIRASKLGELPHEISKNSTLNTLYGSEFIGPLFVSSKIFEDRLTPYFLKDVHRITREDILGVTWNMYITKGYFIKIDKDGSIKEFPQLDKEKYYVSYLEIAGDLGTFHSVYHNRENEIEL